MSLTIKTCNIEGIPHKWELAKLLSTQAKLAETTLKSVFTEAIENLEGFRKTQFDPALKERVWSRVSADKLNQLKETYYLNFCDQILNGFSEAEVCEMLAEFNTIGNVTTSTYKARLISSSLNSYLPLEKAISKKIDSITLNWLSEISQTVQSELQQSVLNAIAIGNLKEVTSCLHNGVDPNIEIEGKNAIHLACEMGQLDILRELLDNGGQIDIKRSQNGNTPFQTALKYNQEAIKAELIARGVDVNQNCDPLSNEVKDNIN